MRTARTVETVETHTGGMPTRIVTAGVDWLAFNEGAVADQRDAFAERFDELRKFLILEPRGHDDMFGAVLVDPEHPDADLGAFFLNVGGCNEDVCIHGLIGVVTALLELGHLPETDAVTVETPGGLVTARPQIAEGRVTAVAIENVPSYVCATDVAVELESFDEHLAVDVVYSGNAFALLDASGVGLDVTPAAVPGLVDVASELLADLQDRPGLETGPATEVNAVSIYQSRPTTDRNLVVAPGGHVDRSPSGTGTAARMVLAHHQGELAVGERYRTESVLGTRFEGTLLSESRRDGRLTVVPEVTGSAHVIGTQTLLRDPDDPLVGFSGLKDRFAPFDLTKSE